MTPRRALLCGGLLMLIAACRSEPPASSEEPGLLDGSSMEAEARLRYPPTATVDQVEEYHGVLVSDPYRWLEDLDSPETAAWVEAQNEVTFAFLETIPEREAIRERLTELWDYERYGVPIHRGSRYFLKKNDGLQNQSVLYTLEALEAEPSVLLDPNRLSPDGTVALSGISVTRDGSLLAYGLSEAGSDWQEWRVRDVSTGEDLDDLIRWVKFSRASWAPDGRGFYYSRYDEPGEDDALEELNFYQKLYYHELGSPQEEDRLIYHRPDRKEWIFDGDVTDDGRYLIITISEGTDPRERVYYKGLGAPDAPVIELLDELDASYEFIDNDGPLFWFLTDLDAPKGRVIAIDTTRPERERWTEVIPEAEETLESVSVIHDTFVATYLEDASTRVRKYRLDGRPAEELELPGIGTAWGFEGRREDSETFFAFSSFTVPPTIFRYDFEKGAARVFRRPAVDFDFDSYETRQVFCTSRDGTRIPVFLTYRKGIPRDGDNPVILYGYGGFNISITPSFSPARLVWLEMGGLYAVANLRGGGEYGEEWHQAGTRLNKQNVFDDFIAAAEWLIESGYTRPQKLAIRGGSNGGLLVGACMTQRPGLFGAALPAVGVLDMLRFHKFTIGWAWTADYGSPEDPEEFQALLAYSPLHNIQPGRSYPATLITTADHDDRVVPAHSFKFAAALQAAQGGSDPVLIRIETRAGHGAGKPTTKTIEEVADRYAFLVKVLGIEMEG